MTELDDNGVAIPSSVTDKLAEFVTVKEGKVDAIGRLALALDGCAESCKQEAKALQSRARKFEERKKRLLHYVGYAMSRAEQKKLEGALCTLTVVAGRFHVEIKDHNLIPDDCMRVVPETREPNLIEIGERLKRGVPVPGTVFVQGEGSVRVYQ
jgi:hypothetical protein